MNQKQGTFKRSRFFREPLRRTTEPVHIGPVFGGILDAIVARQPELAPELEKQRKLLELRKTGLFTTIGSQA